MLNLGIWMSAVTHVHHERRCHHDAFARSVVDTCNNYLSPGAFINVFGRLRVVLSCIAEDGGGNSLVEKKRGKLFRDATVVDLIADQDEYVSEVKILKRSMKIVMIRILKFYFAMGRCCVMASQS